MTTKKIAKVNWKSAWDLLEVELSVLNSSAMTKKEKDLLINIIEILEGCKKKNTTYKAKPSRTKASTKKTAMDKLFDLLGLS